jgi:hypothetical protein
MTREEQIENFANSQVDCEFFDESLYKGIIIGAKWADEHPNLYNDEKYHTVKVSCLDELNRKAVLYDTFLEKACSILEDMTDGRLGKRFISEFKNKLEYGVLERH